MAGIPKLRRYIPKAGELDALGETLDAELQRIRDSVPGGAQLEAFIDQNGDLFLDTIRLPPELQGQGHGTRMLEDLLRWTDERNLQSSVSPSADPGKKEALDRFYKRFGYGKGRGYYDPAAKGSLLRPALSERKPVKKAKGGKVGKVEDDTDYEYDVDENSRLRRRKKLPGPKPLLSMKAKSPLELIQGATGMRAPASLRRAGEDWAEDVAPTNVWPGGQVTGGPDALDALGVLDIPGQAIGEEVFKRTDSPLASTAAYLLPGLVSPRSVAAAGRKVGKLASHLDPRNLAVPIEQLATDYAFSPKPQTLLRGGAETARSLLNKLQERAGAYGDVMSPAMYAVKERGGQWIDPDLSRLDPLPVQGGAHQPGEPELSNWVNKNLRRWIKTSMGTTETDALARELGLLPTHFDEPVSAFYPGRLSLEQAAKSPTSFTAQLFDENPWLRTLAEQDTSLMGKGSTPVHELEDIPESITQAMDYARTLPPDRLKNVSVPDMLRQSRAWHAELAKRQSEKALQAGSHKVLREYPEGFRWVEIQRPDPAALTPEQLAGWSQEEIPAEAGSKWKYRVRGPGASSGSPRGLEVFSNRPEEMRHLAADHVLRQGLNAEGEMMGHCVGNYCEDVKEGTRILSLRDPQGMAHATVEATPQRPFVRDVKAHLGPEGWSRFLEANPTVHPQIPDDARLARVGLPPDMKLPMSIQQIKGKENAAPVAKYRSFVQDMIQDPLLGEPWSEVQDIANTGLVSFGGHYFTPQQLDRAALEFGRIGDEGMDYAESLRRQLAGGLTEQQARGNFLYEFLPGTQRTRTKGQARLELPPEFKTKTYGKGGVVKKGASTARELMNILRGKQGIIGQDVVKLDEEGIKEAIRRAKANLTDVQQIERPGIYFDPKLIAQTARDWTVPESPNLARVYGTTRAQLAEEAGHPGGMTDPTKVIPAWMTGSRVRGAESARNVMTAANRQRIIDILSEAKTGAPGMWEGMRGWYIGKPKWERMVQLMGEPEALKQYMRQAAFQAAESPQMAVEPEMRRAAAANYYATLGPEDFERWLKYGGMGNENIEARHAMLPEIKTVPGRMGFLRDAQRHIYDAGEQLGGAGIDLGMGSPKAPAYFRASGPTREMRQSSIPIADIHFSTGLGLGDVRTAENAYKSASLPEVQTLTPWHQDIARELGEEAVPLQAIQWGVLGPQTGVATKVGAPKLEIEADLIARRAEQLGEPIEKVRDDYLMGKQHLGFARPELLASIGLGTGSALELKRRALAARKRKEEEERAAIEEVIPSFAGGGVIKRIAKALKKYPLASRDEWYGDADYLQRGGQMVDMSPDEFLAQARPLEIDEVSRENIDLLKEHMQAGKTLDPLMLRQGGKEDGRHRAHAARELGIKKVPVIKFAEGGAVEGPLDPDAVVYLAEWLHQQPEAA